MSQSDYAWITAQVTATRNVTPTIREISIALNQTLSCPPGSHIKVRFTAGGRDDLRSYSVVSADTGRVRIAVKLQPESRGGSAYMWSLEPGSVLEIAPPRCDFPLTSGAPHYLLFAGGVGVTPLVAMAEHLVTSGASARMLYAARNSAEFAFRDELEAMLGDRLTLFADDRGEKLDIAAEIDRLPPDGELYICGPLGLMEAVRRAWSDAGRPQARLRFETFGSSGRFEAQPFIVKVPRLKTEVLIRENESMLDALEAAGVEVIFECRRGECGLCAIDILELDGDVDHRDVFFSAHQHAENRRICACVSRVANGSVTIDPAWRGDGAFIAA
jgi:ferredoxin-NADP reductase